jgi:putative FmdB family regulatory protein
LEAIMPIYEYCAKNRKKSCDHCRDGFDQLQSLSEAPLSGCPKCGAAVEKLLSAPAIGASKSGLDSRAKDAGFHKLRRLGKGEYQKEY